MTNSPFVLFLCASISPPFVTPIIIIIPRLYSCWVRQFFWALDKTTKNYQSSSEINWKSLPSLKDIARLCYKCMQYKRETQRIMNKIYRNIFFIWNANKVPEIASRSWLICDVAAAHFPFEMNFATKVL